jgi:hypothetical protein
MSRYFNLYKDLIIIKLSDKHIPMLVQVTLDTLHRESDKPQIFLGGDSSFGHQTAQTYALATFPPTSPLPPLNLRESENIDSPIKAPPTTRPKMPPASSSPCQVSKL